MKSAYEIALERLEAESGPTKKLTEQEKARIADIDAKYDAQVAAVKLGHEAKVAEAPVEELESVQQRLASQLASLEEKREKEKQEIWND